MRKKTGYGQDIVDRLQSVDHRRVYNRRHRRKPPRSTVSERGMVTGRGTVENSVLAKKREASHHSERVSERQKGRKKVSGRLGGRQREKGKWPVESQKRLLTVEKTPPEVKRVGVGNDPQYAQRSKKITQRGGKKEVFKSLGMNVVKYAIDPCTQDHNVRRDRGGSGFYCMNGRRVLIEKGQEERGAGGRGSGQNG